MSKQGAENKNPFSTFFIVGVGVLFFSSIRRLYPKAQVLRISRIRRSVQSGVEEEKEAVNGTIMYPKDLEVRRKLTG